MIINDILLDKVAQAARESERLRMNLNFHESLDDKAQRMINALEPGTVLPIHRHRHTAETYVVLRGRLTVLFYGEQGKVTERFELDPLQGQYGVHIPKGQWHGMDVHEPSVIFEVKEGPYRPIAPEDVLG